MIYENRIENLRYLLPVKQFGDKDIEDPQNFPDAQRVLTVFRIGSGVRQAWAMLDKAIISFKMSPPIAIVKNEQLKKLKSFVEGGSQF